MRGKKPQKRKISPDEKYFSVTVSRFINSVMKDGKKITARNIMYKAMEELATLTGEDALVAFEKALDNVKVKVETKAKRVGGANYQVPMPVSDERQLTLAIRWLVSGSRERRVNTPFYMTLAQELHDAFKGEGSAVKKRDEVHRMAESNKAFAHLAW